MSERARSGAELLRITAALAKHPLSMSTQLGFKRGSLWWPPPHHLTVSRDTSIPHCSQTLAGTGCYHRQTSRCLPVYFVPPRVNLRAGHNSASLALRGSWRDYLGGLLRGSWRQLDRG